MQTIAEALELLCREAEEGELVFPANVGAALKLQEALAEPDCHLDEVILLAQAEPLIAARLVAIANSVAYTRYGGQVTSVRKAVHVIGFRSLRALVAAIVIRQLSQAIHDPTLRASAEALWRHSAHVAALAKILAREWTAIDPETALFAGIVHEIEGFYLLSRSDRYPSLRFAAPREGTLSARKRLTQHVLTALKVPRLIADAVLERFDGQSSAPAITLGDILRLAEEFSPVPSPLAAWMSGGEEPIIAGRSLAATVERHQEEIAQQYEALMV